MIDLRNVFENRELSIIIWISVIFITMMFSKSIRNSIFDILKILLNKTFLVIYFLLAIYLTGIIFLIQELRLWDIGDLKNTLIWFFTVGLVLIYNAVKEKDSKYFISILKEGLKWTIIIEFVVSFYNFSLLTEIIIIPLIVFVVILQAVSELDDKNIQVTKVLSSIINVTGLILFCYSIYKTIYSYEDFFTFETLTSLIVPLMITTLFIPFIYFLALYSAYESFFVRLNFMYTKKTKVKLAKRYIKIIANINLDKLNRIMKKFEKRVFYEDINMKSYISTISKKN